jgi:hypothetical protein
MAHLVATLKPGAEAVGLGFEVTDYHESPGARHVRFVQTLHGVRISDAEVTVSLAKNDDRITLVVGRTLTSVPFVQGQRARLNALDALSIGAAHAEVLADVPQARKSTLVYVRNGATLVLAWQVRIASTQPTGDWRILVAADDGRVLASENLVVFDHLTSEGQVFDPNPVVTAGVTNIPGSPSLTDCDSATATELARFASEYRTYSLQGINAGQDKLRGAYVDLAAHGTGPLPAGYLLAGQADEPTHVFNYDCDDPRFEEVMVYYHVDKAQRVVQSLGFVGGSAILATPLAAHAHFNNECNAFFTTWEGIPAIQFGDGNVGGSLNCPPPGLDLLTDTAEDADIITHEYGHALHYVASGGFIGQEGRGIAEGFADYLASTLNGNPCMYEWRAALGYPDLLCGRNIADGQWLNTSTLNISFHRYYPEDVHSDEHATGLIWAGALWGISVALGDNQAARETVLKLALQGMSYVTPFSGFAEYAVGLRQADSDLFGGANLLVIDQALKDHGICWATGACISGMHHATYSTASSPVNTCTVLVEQSGDGSAPNGIGGDISCTTARDGSFVLGTLNQAFNPPTVSLESLFNDPLVTVQSNGTITADGLTGSGTWDCAPTCFGGTYTSTRFKRTSSSFVYAAFGGVVGTALGDELIVQAGSAASNAVFTIEIEPLPFAPTGVRTISRAYRIGPPGMTFDPPATMVFRYGDEDLAANLDPTELRVMVFNETTGIWEPLGGVVDTDDKTITVTLTHLSKFALFDCATGLINTDADALGDPCDVDDDEDGCTDVEELGADPELGGTRDPLNALDFPDLDDDLMISILDLSFEAALFLQPPSPPVLDLDGDGTITILDLAEMAGQFLHSCAAPP